jgi:hypothetical protein
MLKNVSKKSYFSQGLKHIFLIFLNEFFSYLYPLSVRFHEEKKVVTFFCSSGNNLDFCSFVIFS